MHLKANEWESCFFKCVSIILFSKLLSDDVFKLSFFWFSLCVCHPKDFASQTHLKKWSSAWPCFPSSKILRSLHRHALLYVFDWQSMIFWGNAFAHGGLWSVLPFNVWKVVTPNLIAKHTLTNTKLQTDLFFLSSPKPSMFQIVQHWKCMFINTVLKFLHNIGYLIKEYSGRISINIPFLFYSFEIVITWKMAC